jgi:hypothetical protein
MKRPKTKTKCWDCGADLPTHKNLDKEVRKALRRANGRALSKFRPVTFPNKKKEAKKTGAIDEGD